MTVRVAVFEGVSRVGDISENLAAIRSTALAAADADVQVLVTPELFISGYDPKSASQVDGQSHRDSLGRLAQECSLWIASATVEWDHGCKHILGTLHAPGGSVALSYRKRMLFDVETKYFTPGTDASAVVNVAGVQTSLAICFDVEFPELVRESAHAGAELLLVPTAVPLRETVNGMPPAYDTTLVPRQMVPVRALESQLAIAYANHGGEEFAGHSVVADPFGGTTFVSSGHTFVAVDVDPAQVEEARADTPYLARTRREQVVDPPGVLSS